MATTQNTFTGNGSNLGPFSFTFKWLEPTDVKVSVGGVLKTAGTHYNLQNLNYTTKTGGEVLFTSGNAPASGSAIRVFRDTDDSALSATFNSGSAIRAQDLNDNFTQNLYVVQEINNNAVQIDGSQTMVGDLDMGGYQINNLASPTADTDAVNRAYVNNIVANGIGDGDKGDIIVSGSGSTFTIDASSVTNSKVASNASIVSSKLAFTQSGTGAVQRTVEAKLQDVVSVKDFGAVGDGVTNDRAALQAALDTGKNVFIPDGIYLFNSSISYTANGQAIYGSGNNSILKSGSGSVYISTNGKNNVSIFDLKVDGTGTNGGYIINSDSKNVTVSNVYWYKGGQRVWLYTCEFVTVSGCTFEECGYQVIQQLGYASSNCKVVNCTSINCDNDFVELNCEVNNPSRNWLIAGNVVKNVGMVGAVNTKTESRFVGATMVDGIVISGNIVDGVAGDSAVHLERPGRTIIAGNTFRNASGYASIWLLPGSAAGWVQAQDVVISSNTFIQDQEPLTGSSKVFIRSIDSTYRNNINIVNNQFYYYGTSYPSDPGTQDFTGVDVAFNLNYTRITGNYFKNLLSGVRLGTNSGGAPSIAYLPEIDNNHFHLCTTAITFSGTTTYAKSIARNTFQGCTSPWNSLPSNDFVSIANVGANDFISTNVSGFASSFITNPTWLPDSYQQSTTDDARAGITMAQSVATQLVKIPFRFTGLLTVFAESTISATNNKREVFFVSNRGATSFTSLGSHSAGTAPTIALTASGTYGQIISATLTGGPVGHSFNVRITLN